ncbi:nucleotidyltransferase family protein [Methanolobus sp. WCC4]|uniref:nucleotidyltransferase family protein n=1 Tax=Methanolobus sp. WCC4 TaxID=3125784 RepID=UPI0030FCEAFB
MGNTNNTATEECIKQLRELLPELERKFDVSSIAIFTPYVRNEQNKKSDIYLLVEYIEMPGLLGFIEHEKYLSDKLGIKVELVLKTAPKTKIGKDMLNEIIPIEE